MLKTVYFERHHVCQRIILRDSAIVFVLLKFTKHQKDTPQM